MAEIIIITVIVVLLLIFFIVLFAVAYVQRKTYFEKEKQEMHKSFEEILMQSQLEIQEQIFANISRDIHDNVGQLLSLAKMQINLMEQSNAYSSVALKELRENLSLAMSDLRDIAKSLSGERVNNLGLLKVVEQEAERINRSTQLQIDVHASGEEKHLPLEKQLIAFRIIQETLQNIIKHANATCVKIHFRYVAHAVEISIQDNGKGFNLEETLKNGNGMGIENMLHRTAVIKGKATIRSIPGNGTSIKFIFVYE